PMLINQLTFTKPAGTSSAVSATPAASVTGGAATAKSTGKAGSAKATKKPLPGSAAAAQAEANAVQPFVPDSNTLTLTLAGEVFSMSSNPAALPSTPVSPAPAK